MLDYETQSLISEAVLACLRILVSGWACRLEDPNLLIVVSYTNKDDAWTTERSSSFASELLSIQLARGQKEAFIVDRLLQSHLRNIFSKSSVRVTASGRPSHFQDSVEQPDRKFDPPAWKQAGPGVLTCFQWVVNASDVSDSTSCRREVKSPH